MSIEDNVIPNTRVANSVRPSLVIDNPPVNVSPAIAGSAKVRARVMVPSAKANSWTLFWAAPAEYNFVPSGFHTRPYHALSSGVVLFTVQLAMSTTVNDGRLIPLLVITA